MPKPLKKKEKPTLYGGQAAMEGVMMRGRNSYALAVRAPDKTIKVKKKRLKSSSERSAILKLPIVRGVVNFGSSLVTGTKIIYDSADMAGFSDLAEEQPTRFEKWLERKFGDKLFDYIMYFSVVIAILLAVGLFMLLPVWISSFLNGIIGERKWILSVSEGIIRVFIFLGYLTLMSKVKDIKRVFQYHGAEHMTINCYEHGEELTVQNVRKYSRQQKRCGTSFLLFVMLVSMVVFFFIRFDNIWLRLLSRFLLIPVIAGLSYELIMWAGRSKSRFVSIFSAPGMWLQKLTTGVPDDGQIEVAVEALYGVLEDDGVIKRRTSVSECADTVAERGDIDGAAGRVPACDEGGEPDEDGACDAQGHASDAGTDGAVLQNSD